MKLISFITVCLLLILIIFFYENKIAKIEYQSNILELSEKQSYKIITKLKKEKQNNLQRIEKLTLLTNTYKDKIKYKNAEMANIIAGIEIGINDSTSDISNNIFEKLNDELYLNEYIKTYGIKNYHLRYDWIKFPFRDPKDKTKPDLTTVITSEYDTRPIYLNRNQEINILLNSLGLKTGDYRKILYIKDWGQCYHVRVRENIITFLQLHTGVDVTNKKNNAIYGPAKGIVVAIYENHEIFGNTIVIRCHKNFETFRINYSHLSEIRVKLYQKINEKTLLGMMGDTGKTLGQHLHWSIRYYNKPYHTVNPFMNTVHKDIVSRRKFYRGELY